MSGSEFRSLCPLISSHICSLLRVEFYHIALNIPLYLAHSYSEYSLAAPEYVHEVSLHDIRILIGPYIYAVGHYRRVQERIVPDSHEYATTRQPHES